MDGRQAPVVLSSVVLVLELSPVGVVHGHEHWLLIGACLSGLVVDVSGVDGPCVLRCSLVLLLVLHHEVFDGARQLLRHSRVAGAVLG